MLENLSIKNFVIVNHLELNFKSGFSALTGETGAGKSILIGALSLTLGQRADTSVVRHNTDKSDISATFSIEDNINAQEWLKQNELESEEGNLFLRRVIYQDPKRPKASITPRYEFNFQKYEPIRNRELDG